MLQLEFTVVFLQLLATEVSHLYLTSHVLGGRLLLGLLADKALKSRWLYGQVFDRVNAEGVYCNLHTGQEKKNVPFASHMTCTVEMLYLKPLYLNHQWKVAVI
jgi:hypothetical protein